MSSLITTASPWISDEPPKKRTSTLKKPTKTTLGDSEEYVSTAEAYQNIKPSTIDEVQAATQDRNTRVNDLLNKITSVDNNDNSKMGEFKPPPTPSMNVKKDMGDNTAGKSFQYTPPSYSEASLSMKEAGGGPYVAKGPYVAGGPYVANDSGVFSNYTQSYQPAVIKPYYANMGIGSAGDSKLMEKINYMIHLLEEQQLEKTNHITEEFILYTFLGVFIIFIVDSFSRSGKYTR